MCYPIHCGLPPMWDDVDEEKDVEREEELRGNRESALEILKSIVARRKKIPPQMPKPCETKADLAIKDNIPRRPTSGSGKSSESLTIHPNEVRLDDKVIIVMGLTGCGSSNFLDHLTKSTKWSGTSLRSVTQGVQAIRIPLFNTNVVLVDTPGFDNTNRSGVTILELIGEWMKKTYEKDIKLTGILYLHRITDVRMSGTAFQTLRMFGKLCGDKAASRVIFVTTMWDKTSTRQGEQIGKKEQKEKEQRQREQREKELKENYWRPMLELGTRTDRFSQNKEHCAQDIIKRLLDLPASEAIPTLLQEETVDQHRAVFETTAAKGLYSQMQTLLSQHRAGLENLQEAAKRTNNPQMLAELQKEEARVQLELDRTFADSRKLKLCLLRRIRLFFTRKTDGTSIDFSTGSPSQSQ